MIQTIALSVSSALQEALEAFLFGEMWYFGILVFILLAVSLMKTWKYAGVFIIPIIMALEVAYYERNNEFGVFIWPMLILLFLAIGVALYSVMGNDKN